MATIVRSGGGGMAVGGSIGGSVLGLSGSAIGRAAGAALGRAIDGRILGAGSEPVPTGRVDRFRLTGASEGAAVAQVHGRIRIAGQVIWAGPFIESVTTTGSGKGTSQPGEAAFTYRVSVAIGLCEGEITRVGRVWADGVEIARDDLNLRLYRGTPGQVPDPCIEAVEGAGNVPAFRGIAYVVMEDLALGPVRQPRAAVQFRGIPACARARPRQGRGCRATAARGRDDPRNRGVFAGDRACLCQRGLW